MVQESIASTSFPNVARSQKEKKIHLDDVGNS